VREHRQIRDAAGRHHSQVTSPQTMRGMQSGAPDGLHRVHSIAHHSPQQVAHTTFFHQEIRRNIVGAQRQRGWQLRQAVDGFHYFRQ